MSDEIKPQLSPEILAAMEIAAKQNGFDTPRQEAVNHLVNMLTYGNSVAMHDPKLNPELVMEHHNATYIALQLLGISKDEIVKSLNVIDAKQAKGNPLWN